MGRGGVVLVIGGVVVIVREGKKGKTVGGEREGVS